MKKNKLVGFVVCIFIILMLVTIPTYAQFNNEKHLTLLAVSEDLNGNITGASADLFLEIKPGKGRVFIDTFPLTQMDTQISTRFAKEIACDFLERNKKQLKHVNCNNYDFIYTIKSDAPIIGGPSAGAAISLLTISSLAGLDADEKTAITGTINSGGFIGVVSGIKEKINAASEAGIKKVLIPAGTRHFIKDEEEIDLKDYAAEKSIELIEVEGLDDVVSHFTGQEIEKSEKQLEVNKKYLDIMRKVSKDLCSRSRNFVEKLDIKISKQELDVLKQIDEFSNLSEKAFLSEKYYSSASYCFGANVKLNSLHLKQQNLSYEDSVEYAKIIKKEVIELEKEIDSKEIKTISNLQTYMVVKERIIETKELLDEVKEELDKVKNDDDNYLYDLGFAEERYHSALSWMVFFDSNISEKQLFKDKKVVSRLCAEKLEEAEERMHYLGLILPINLNGIRKEINYAKKDLDVKNYELCLFKALKAKAQANSILNIMNVKQEYINKSIETKLNIIKNNIIMENENNIFPIMGYSYYEYADELKYSDVGSALLYAEYALELSNFHVYLDSVEQDISSEIVFNNNYGLYIVIFLIGLAVGLVYNFRLSKKAQKQHRKRK